MLAETYRSLNDYPTSIEYLLAIDNASKEKNKIFPNPTSGIVNITTDSNADVQIYSLDGKMIQSQKMVFIFEKFKRIYIKSFVIFTK